jgi:hypothetical protein
LSSARSVVHLQNLNLSDMSLSNCRECGAQVSTSAKSCPHCGTPKPTTPGWARHIPLIVVVSIIALVWLSSLGGRNSTQGSNTENSTTSASSTLPTHHEGETLTVGYTSYAVQESRWINHLSSNQFLDKSPNANWLAIRITVRNDDNKARIVPPFNLVDENGAEYEESSDRWQLDGHFILENLNPSVSKTGMLLFDVPRGHTYNLKLSGGYWSGKSSLVALRPKN